MPETGWDCRTPLYSFHIIMSFTPVCSCFTFFCIAEGSERKRGVCQCAVDEGDARLKGDEGDRMSIIKL